MKDKTNSLESKNPRQKTEEHITIKSINTDVYKTDIEILKIIQELDVHQKELELQNLKLLSTTTKAEADAEKYTNLYDFTPSGYFTLSKEGIIKDLNYKGANLLKKKRSLLLKKQMGIFISEETKPIFNLFLKKIFDSKTKQACEISLSIVPNTTLNVTLSGIVSEDGEKCLVTMIDISKLKKAEETTEVSEEKYRTLYETNRDSITIFRIDSDNKPGNFIEANPATTNLFGYTKEELLAMSVIDIEILSDKKRKARIETLLSQGKIDFETVIKNKKGYLRNVEIETILINYLNEPAVMNITRDITERKLEQLVLKTQKIKLETVIKGTKTATWEWNIKTGETVFDERWAEIIGYTLDEISPVSIDSWIKFTHPDDLIKSNQLLEKCFNGEIDFYECEARMKHKNGDWIWILDRGGINKWDIDGKPLLMSGTHQDITELKKNEETLRESKEELSTIFNVANSGILVIDAKGKFINFNDKWPTMLGYTRDEMNTMSLYDMIHPNELENVKEAINKIIIGRQKEVPLYERLYIKKDKSNFYGEVSLSVIKNVEGDTYNIIAVVIDITERKKAEEALQKSQEKLRGIFDLANSGIILTDLKGKYLLFNNWFAKALGYTRTELNNLTVVELTHPDDLEKSDASFNKIVEGNVDRYQIEKRFVRKDKSFFWAEVSVSAIKDKHNKTVNTIGIITDITERRNAKEKLENSEKRLRTIFDTANSGIVLTDATGKILDINYWFSEMFGYSNEEACMLTNMDITHPVDLEENKLCYNRLLNGEVDKYQIEKRYIKKDKSHFWAKLSVSAIKDENNKVINTLGIINDITEQRKNEKKLKKSEARLIAAQAVAKIGSWETDFTYTDVLLSDETGKIFGLKSDTNKLTLEIFLTIVHPEDRSSVETTFVHSIKSNTINSFEHRIITPAGIEKIVEQRWEILRDNQGNPYRALGTCQDITERKLAETKLIANEKFLYQTQIIANLGSYSLDFTTGKWTSTNVLDKIFGIDNTFDKTINGWVSIIHPEWRAIMNDYLNNEVIAKKINFNKEYKIIKVDSKEERWVQGNGEITFNKQGQPIRLIGSIQDISERKLAEEKLKITSEKFQDLVNSTGGIVWEADAKTFNFTYVSEQAERLLGYRAKEWQSPNFWVNHLHPEDKEHTIEYCVGQTNQMKAHDFTYRFRAKDGKYIWLRDIVNVVVEDGKPRWLRGVMFDITEQKENEESLRENEEKYRGLVEGSPDAIVIYADDKIAYINSEGLKLLGAKNTQEIIGKPVLQFVHPDSRADVIKRMEEVISDEKTSKIEEERFISLNGVPFDVEIKAIPTIYDRKNAVQVIVHDITDRKRTQEKIRQLSQAVEQSPVSIVITNIKGEIEYANPKFVESTGYSLEEVIHQNSRVLKSGYTSPNEYSDLWQKITAGKEWHGEFHNKKKDGSLYWESASISPIVNSEGIITHFIAIKEDITHRKNVEKELVKSKERAEESDRLKLVFLANMSHEIRTPMNGILGFTELLKAPQLSGEEQQEYIKIIEQSGKRMLNIINDIISISKVESGQVEVSLSETNVNEQVEYIHTFFKPEAKQKGIKLYISKQLDSKDTLIKTDREKLYAILTNLVKNAIKFTSEGSIEFGCEKKGNYLEFFVKDSGLGIPKSQQQLIFERFRQANETVNRSYEGSGLGLAISKAYVEILGGTIWVESEEGKGSTFYFTIPFDTEFIPTEKNKTIKVDSENKEENKINDLKVLIVDDDAISKLLITKALKNFSKEIIKVSSGLEAIKACQKNPDIDLVMMDINMPEMDGYEATRRIREFNKDLVIIAQTANAMQRDRQEAMKSGCTDYIAKPINLNVLNELLQKYFKK